MSWLATALFAGARSGAQGTRDSSSIPVILRTGFLRDLFWGRSPLLSLLRTARRLPQSMGLILLPVLLVLPACRPEGPGGRSEEGEAPPAKAGAVHYVEISQGSEPIAMNAGEVHFRDFSLHAGDFLRVVVEQQGIDVVLSLLGPENQEILRVDSPNGREGPEEILQIAELPGRYRVEIHSAEISPAEGGKAAGLYSLREALHRPAHPQDRERIAGDRLDREGRRLAKENAGPEAIQRFTQAREVWRRLGLRQREAETLRHLGLALSASGDLPAAREAWDLALSWYRALGLSGRSVLLQDLGKLEARLGEMETAIRHLEEARSLFEGEGDERGLVSTFSALGATLWTYGSFQRALECFETAVEQSRELKDPELEASVQVDRGALLLQLDRTKEALAAYEQALGIYRGLADPEGISWALRGISDAYTRAGAFHLAEKAAREAIAAGGGSRARVAALSSLGNVRRRLGDWAGARRSLEEALAVAREGGYRRDEANILTSLAYTATREGEPRRGLDLYDEALRIFREIGNRSGEAMVQARSAEALRDLDRLDDAWRRVDQALHIIEELRATTNRQDYRLSYFGSRQEYYEIAVDVLLDLERRRPGSASRAFAVHERRLARELLEALSLADQPRAAVDPALQEEERRLERELSELADPLELGTATRLAEVIERLQTVRGRIRAARAGQKQEVETVDLKTVQTDLLDGDTLSLVYALGGERSHLFEISQEDFRVHSLPGRGRIESKVQDFVKALQRTDRRHLARQESLGRELGDLLLGPAGPRLITKKRLVIVAEGALQGLPFAALASPEQEHRYLGEGHEVLYLPSWSMLKKLRSAEARRPAKQGRAGAFADPVFSTDEERSLGHPFPRLPASRREVEALQTLWGDGARPWIAVRFEAHREALLEKDWNGFEMLYFATHAIGHRRPGLSGLVLSMVDAQGRPQPGFVSGLEISRLSLPVDLVVLSACETASGERERGEGTLGLSWSFLQAGATRVVATLWRVDDRRTADLMTRFLELYRREGLSPSAALQRAQQEALGRPRALPRDWAGFIFVGDWRRPARHLKSASQESRR